MPREKFSIVTIIFSNFCFSSRLCFHSVLFELLCSFSYIRHTHTYTHERTKNCYTTILRRRVALNSDKKRAKIATQLFSRHFRVRCGGVLLECIHELYRWDTYLLWEIPQVWEFMHVVRYLLETSSSINNCCIIFGWKSCSDTKSTTLSFTVAVNEAVD